MSKRGMSWSITEDTSLTEAVRAQQIANGKLPFEAHKANWNAIAAEIPGRTAGGCQARYNAVHSRL